MAVPGIKNAARSAYRAGGLAALALLLSFTTGWTEEVRRINRPRPTFEEQQRIAADMAKNDGLLRQGDIVVTERGFLVFKGVGADGFTNQFETIPNPLNRTWSRND